MTEEKGRSLLLLCISKFAERFNNSITEKENPCLLGGPVRHRKLPANYAFSLSFCVSHI